MTKKQKIWFAVFLAMFAVPEVLWGGIIGRVIYYWILGSSVKGGILSFSLLSMPKSVNLIKFIYLTEFIGALSGFFYAIVFYHPKNKLFKFLLLIILGLLLLVAFLYVLFAISFSGMSIG